jgi:hypothetical protein
LGLIRLCFANYDSSAARRSTSGLRLSANLLYLLGSDLSGLGTLAQLLDLRLAHLASCSACGEVSLGRRGLKKRHLGLGFSLSASERNTGNERPAEGNAQNNHCDHREDERSGVHMCVPRLYFVIRI